MIKTRTIKINVVEFYDVCGKCGREIKGSKESQVLYNMETHKKTHDKGKK